MGIWTQRASICVATLAILVMCHQHAANAERLDDLTLRLERLQGFVIDLSDADTDAERRIIIETIKSAGLPTGR